MLLLPAARGRLVLRRHRAHRRHAAAPPHHVEIRVPQDGGDPGLEVRARLELVGMRKRAHHRFLHQIVGKAPVMRQQHRKRTQMRQLLDDALVQVGSLVVWHGGLAPWTLAIYSPFPCKKFRPFAPRAPSAQPCRAFPNDNEPNMGRSAGAAPVGHTACAAPNAPGRALRFCGGHARSTNRSSRLTGLPGDARGSQRLRRAPDETIASASLLREPTTSVPSMAQPVPHGRVPSSHGHVFRPDANTLYATFDAPATLGAVRNRQRLRWSTWKGRRPAPRGTGRPVAK